MELHAFELSPDYKLDELVGATTAYGPLTHTFDIKAALVAGDGVIVTDDSVLVGTLRGNPLLQETEPPPGVDPVVPPGQEDAQPVQPTLYEPQTPGNLVPGTPVPASVAAASPADAPADEVLAAERKTREQAGIGASEGTGDKSSEENAGSQESDRPNRPPTIR